MRDLVAFLTQRLDEDEHLAREAGGLAQGDGVASWLAPCWAQQAREEGDTIDYQHEPCHCCRVEGDNITIYDEGGHDRTQALHIAHWDPRRVVAEVQAQRAIVNWCVKVIDERDMSGYGKFGCLRYDLSPLAVTLAMETLLCLARPYADHPGYQPSWVPPPSP